MKFDANFDCLIKYLWIDEMLEKFIIDGNYVEIEVLRKVIKSELLDVTSFSDTWINYIHSGLQFLQIQRKHIDENEIFETFQIIGENEGVLILKTIENIQSS
jgi:hypothetical protein